MPLNKKNLNQIYTQGTHVNTDTLTLEYTHTNLLNKDTFGDLDS